MRRRSFLGAVAAFAAAPMLPPAKLNPIAATMTITGSGFAVGDAVVFTTWGSLPQGLTDGATYYVRAVHSDSFTIQVKP